MSDQRDILDVLKFELDFLEQGGYGRSVRTPWKPTSLFQDSPTCINFNHQGPHEDCSECLLSKFVPSGFEEEDVPCHHIPLNEHGQTIHSMDRQQHREETEDALRSWLRATIARLEAERQRQELKAIV